MTDILLEEKELTFQISGDFKKGTHVEFQYMITDEGGVWHENVRERDLGLYPGYTIWAASADQRPHGGSVSGIDVAGLIEAEIYYSFSNETRQEEDGTLTPINPRHRFSLVGTSGNASLTAALYETISGSYRPAFDPGPGMEKVWGLDAELNVSFTVKWSANFKFYASVSGDCFPVNEQLFAECVGCPPVWCPYSSRVPDGLAPMAGNCYYVMSSNPSFTLQIGDSVVYGTIDADAYYGTEEGTSDDATWWNTVRNIGQLGFSAASVSNSDGSSFFPHPGVQVNAYVTRTGLAQPNWGEHDYHNDIDHKAHVKLAGNHFTIDNAIGGSVSSCTLLDIAGASAVSYDTHVLYVDNRTIIPGVTSKVRVLDEVPYFEPNAQNTVDCRGGWEVKNQYTDIDIIGSGASLYFPGWWRFSWEECLATDFENPMQRPDDPCHQEVIGYWLKGNPGDYHREHGWAWIVSPAALGEPSHLNDPIPYGDCRLVAKLDKTWQNALSITVPESLRVLSFTDATGWTTQNCTVQAEALGITVTVTGPDAYLQKTFSSHDYSLSGARFANLDFTTDSNNKILLQIAGRQYDVDKTTKEFDVLAPKNFGGAGITGSLITHQHPESGIVNTAPWDWGIDTPGLIKFSNLENGKVYHIYGITLKRKTEPRVVIMPEANWHEGNLPLNPSDVGLEFAGHNGGSNADVWYQRNGYIIVDGVVSEIIGTKFIHDFDGAGQCATAWIIEEPLTNTGYTCYPANDNNWINVIGEDDPDCKIDYLEAGVYDGAHGEINIDAVLKVDAVSVPLNWPDLNMGFAKRYRARCLVRVIDDHHQKKSFRVRITAGTGANETNEILLTNQDGWFLTPAVNTLTALKVEALDYEPPAPNQKLEATITTRNRMLSVCVLKGPMVQPQQEFRVLSGYQEDQSRDENVFVNEQKRIQRWVNGSFDKEVTAVNSGPPGAMVHDSGISNVYYFSEGDFQSKLLESEDVWGSNNAFIVNDPNCQAFPNETWDLFKHMTTLMAPLSKQSFGAGWYKIQNNERGRIVVYVDPNWYAIGDPYLVPEQMPSVAFDNAGQGWVFFHGDTNCYSGKVDIENPNWSMFEIITGNYKHPSVAWNPVSGIWYVVAYNDDSDGLDWFRMDRNFNTLESYAIDANMILDGAIPPQVVEPQKVYLMFDHLNRLRMHFWDGGVKSCTLFIGG